MTRFRSTKVAGCLIAGAAVIGGMGTATPASAAPIECAVNAAGSASPGITAAKSTRGTFSFNGTVTCAGGISSGAINGSGSYSGTCASLTATLSVGGVHSGSLSLKTQGPVVSGGGRYAGHTIQRVTATLFPTKGNCVQPFTQGRAALVLQLKG